MTDFLKKSLQVAVAAVWTMALLCGGYKLGQWQERQRKVHIVGISDNAGDTFPCVLPFVAYIGADGKQKSCDPPTNSAQVAFDELTKKLMQPDKDGLISCYGNLQALRDAILTSDASKIMNIEAVAVYTSEGVVITCPPGMTCKIPDIKAPKVGEIPDIKAPEVGEIHHY